MFSRRGGLAVGRGRRGSADPAPLMWAIQAGKEEVGENSRFPPSLKPLPLNYSEMCGFLHNLKAEVNLVAILKDAQGWKVTDYVVCSILTALEYMVLSNGKVFCFSKK